ncbi:hypothetical protein K469DRAFT_341538 [Zopfia rhizophila CBS 207.26]|uniref:Uncharacterized protein n=1 Tax=Zopfia rhizophila CBS 207.26 TaxID=1314779 RepID=A0A6A6ELZ2_9PEZI|nr:hypothetical protein K469DRAFT_341538 [Zopfia rhizophila CBS 207.26]
MGPQGHSLARYCEPLLSCAGAKEDPRYWGSSSSIMTSAQKHASHPNPRNIVALLQECTGCNAIVHLNPVSLVPLLSFTLHSHKYRFPPDLAAISISATDTVEPPSALCDCILIPHISSLLCFPSACLLSAQRSSQPTSTAHTTQSIALEVF